jgi:GlpG protein
VHIGAAAWERKYQGEVVFPRRYRRFSSMQDEADPVDEAPRQRAPLTWILIALCVIVAIITWLGEDLRRVAWFTFADFQISPDGRSIASSWPDDLISGQIWRPISPIFLHFGFLHIVFNMMWLKDLGGAIEFRQSSRFLFWQVLVIGVLSNVAQFWVNYDFQRGLRLGPQPMFGGMSGVVFGLLGYLWIRGRRDAAYGLVLNSNTVVMMLGWLVLCFAGVVGSIANTAHAVGLLAGMMWGAWSSRPSRLERPDQDGPEPL